LPIEIGIGILRPRAIFWGMQMQKLLWILVIAVAAIGIAVMLVSANFPAIQQAAIGSMITGLVACAFAIAYAITAIRRS